MGLEGCVAVLREHGAERLYFLGDAVGYLPLAEDVLAILDRENAVCQLGNHEGMLCGMISLDPSKDETYRLGELRARLSSNRIAQLANWPRRREVALDGVRILLVHGSPSDELAGYVYPDTDITAYADLAYDIVFVGQTHIPFCREAGKVRVVNVGSCGLPRDGTSDASCALLDTRSGEVELLRARFDIQALLERSERCAPVPASVRRLLARAAA